MTGVVHPPAPTRRRCESGAVDHAGTAARSGDANEAVTASRSDGSPRRPAHERSTRQKRALAAILDASDGFRSAQDLHAELQAQGQNIALTTVYNQVRALAEAGELDALRGDDGETRYRRCTTDEHHHHLVCRRVRHRDRSGRAGGRTLGGPDRPPARLRRRHPHR